MSNNLDDELEEIRKLISEADPVSPSASSPPVPQRPKQGVPMSSSKPEPPNTGADFRAPLNRQKDGHTTSARLPNQNPYPTSKSGGPPHPSQRQNAQVPQIPQYSNKSLTTKPTQQNPNLTTRSNQLSRIPQQRGTKPPSQLSSRGAQPPLRTTPLVPQTNRNVPITDKKSPPVAPIRNDAVRKYDISSTGNISEHHEIKTAQKFDITPDGKISKHRDRPLVSEPDLDIGNENFEVNFDFDGEYRDVPEEKPIRLRREKRTGCVGGIMYAAFIICISLVLASLIWMATVDILGFGTIDEQVSVEIPFGFEMADVSALLYDAGLIRYRWLFEIYADFSSAEERIIPGIFTLNKNFDYRALVQGMTARAGVREEVTVTIPEGFTLFQIFTLLEDHGVVHSADDLWETATYHEFDFHFLDEDTVGERYRLEGFLFPNTYNFFKASSPTPVLNRLLREFDRRFTEEYVERAEDMGLSIRDVINIAAMVEREAANDEERPRIAAVIYNRLESPLFPNLEIDATLSYAVQGTDQIASTTLDHPFNTYIHPGLPPWPIANPGIASIRAALFPEEDTNEYFYALHVDGTHRFFRTYPEHRAFVQSEDFGRWL